MHFHVLIPRTNWSQSLRRSLIIFFRSSVFVAFQFLQLLCQENFFSTMLTLDNKRRHSSVRFPFIRCGSFSFLLTFGTRIHGLNLYAILMGFFGFLIFTGRAFIFLCPYFHASFRIYWLAHLRLMAYRTFLAIHPGENVSSICEV